MTEQEAVVRTRDTCCEAQAKIELAELTDAFNDGFSEHHYYLDLETSEVVFVNDETQSELERIYEEIHGEEDETKESFAEALEKRNLPEWRREFLVDAERVEQEFGTRFIIIPKIESGDDYEAMEDFAESLQDERLQERLWRALKGRRPFRHFKDVVNGLS